jgi:hypothetical protein
VTGVQTCALPISDELKRGGILSRGEVNETKVVGDDPLQGGEVQRALQARRRGDEFTFGKVAHGCILKNNHLNIIKLVKYSVI